MAGGGEFFSKERMKKRRTSLEARRSPHLGDWQKITQVIRPQRGQYLVSGDSESSKKPTSMVNSTPAVASRVLRAGMIGGASSPSYEWFKLQLDDGEMAKWGPAKISLEQRERILYAYLAASNFYQQLQVLYGDSADFGTAVGLIDPHPRDRFVSKLFSPGQYFIDVDEAGDIDTIYVDVTVTVIQLMSRWKDSASAKVKEMYSNGDYNKPVRLLLVLEPNQVIKDSRADWQGKPWVKFIFEFDSEGETEKDYLEISGYDEWPGFDLRWDIDSGNIWGSGPGLLALGDAAALQTTEFRDAQGLEKAVKPPLTAPIFLKNKGVNQTPGGVTYFDPFAANAAKVEPIYNVQPGVLQALQSSIARHEYRINEVYYKDLFLMLATTDRREITAREVEEKHQEKLLNLGPALMRTHRDTLSRCIIRIYRMLDSAGLFPPAPAELRNRSLSIRYTSALAYAQRAAGASALERFFGFTGNISAAYPSVRHKININKGVDFYADAIGVPAEIMRSDDEADASAQAEAQAAQAPQQATAAKDMAASAELLSRTDTARPSVLNYLLSRSGM